jgi:hypothetical protein
MKRIVIAAMISAAALTATACGVSSSSSRPASQAASPSTVASSPAALTNAQGQQICNDLLAWVGTANNEDQPRFTPALQTDEQEASGTQLGQDLSALDDDLQTENTLPLLPGPPGQPSDWQVLASDCHQFGVTLPAGG